MPCLVPDLKRVAAMPNGFKGVIPDEKMNVMPKQRIIPEEKSESPEDGKSGRKKD
jgi:hypothetical protein